MQLKKAIALFCLIVLCMQVLPVKQIGSILFNNQITEEIAHSAETVKKPLIEKQSDNYLSASLNYNINNFGSANKHSIHAKDALVRLHVAEVQTPPPNVV